MVNRGGVGAVVAHGRATVLLTLLALGGIFLLRHDLSRVSPSHPAHLKVAEAQAQFAALPLAFEPNLGQSSRAVKFLAHGTGYGLFLTQDEAVLALPAAQKGVSPTALHMQFAGTNGNAEVAAKQPLPGHTNYMIGNDSSRWVRNVPQFARVQYRNLYPGVDLDFYGKQGRMEYDFEVNPGADPTSIKLQFSSAKNLRIAANGDLVIALADREIRFQAPHLYQASPVSNHDVSGRFVLLAQDQAGFEVGNYDRSHALIIDPVLTFSTYFGGSGAESCSAITGATFVPHCPAVAVDSVNRVYLAGATTSATGFPTPTSPVTTIPPGGGNSDVFVARITNNGTALALDFLTFIGGSGTDYPVGVAVDSGFNVYLAGNTTSNDFPTMSTGFQTSVPVAGNHVFFTELNSSFGGPVYSTFLAGGGVDTASDMALDTQGRAYIFGTTTSTTSTPPFPTTTGALQTSALAANQFFFSKLNSNLNGPNSLLYSTFLGGSSPANGVVMGGGIAVDANLNVYMAGGTTFTDMPLVNAFQAANAGGFDVWAAKLSAPANNTQQYTPVYETYFGGTGDDIAYGVTSDSGSTDMYITGSTTSPAISPVSTAPALQSTYAGGTDAFLTKFGGTTTVGTTQGAVQLIYFTYLGGTGQDLGLSVVTDTNQNAYMTGLTTSGSLPNPNPLFQSPGGGTDAFFARIVTTTISTTTVNTSSTSILGGSGSDIGTSIALDSGLSSYIGGETASANFPHASDPAVPPITPLQASPAGASDAFVSKIGPNFKGLSFVCTGSGCPTNPPANPTVNPSPVGVGNTTTFAYSIFNLGDPVNGAIITDNVGPNSTISSTSANGGTCSANGTTEICNLGTIPSSSTTGTPAVTAPAATVSFVVTATAPAPTTPPTRPPSLGNSAVLSVAGTNFQVTASNSATVNDFGVSVAGQSSQTVTAGNQGSYSLLVTPTGIFPESVSLSCGSGLPSGATCAFQGANPITNLSNGAQNRILDITTTPRVTTPASLFRSGPIYAFWLPISGFTLIGSGFSRRRRWLLAILIGGVLGAVALQAGCSSANNTSTTTGTPAGTYTITVNAASGSATRTTAVTLIVQ